MYTVDVNIFLLPVGWFFVFLGQALVSVHYCCLLLWCRVLFSFSYTPKYLQTLTHRTLNRFNYICLTELLTTPFRLHARLSTKALNRWVLIFIFCNNPHVENIDHKTVKWVCVIINTINQLLGTSPLHVALIPLL